MDALVFAANLMYVATYFTGSVLRLRLLTLCAGCCLTIYFSGLPHVFVPRVAVVAPDGSVSRYVELNFEPIAPRLPSRTTGWQGSLSLAPGESRLAVYTATLLPQTLRLPMPDEAGGYWYVPAGPTGVIEVTLDGR